MTLCKWFEYTEKFKLYHYRKSCPVEFDKRSSGVNGLKVFGEAARF
jgi:hypothetical protein